MLWEAQNICYPPLVKAFQQNGWGAAKTDPIVQRFDELTHLADQLQIRALQP